MRTGIVFTLTGPDRVGIVEEITRVMLDLGANVETSRAVRLGGEFAVLMLVSVPAGQAAGIESAFGDLVDQGYRVQVSHTVPGSSVSSERLTYQITVQGADHEGIVHEIARGLAEQGINIEAMDTSTSEAPVTGTPLFSMSAIVSVPPELAEAEWMGALIEAGELAGVDVEACASDSARTV